MIRKKPQTFNHGVVKIYELTDIAEPGDAPKDGLRCKETLRYHRRTVGLIRMQTALQENVQVSDFIRCPYRLSVSSQDVAVINGQQFRIRKVQRPEEITPPVMDLELERLEQSYGFAEN